MAGMRVVVVATDDGGDIDLDDLDAKVTEHAEELVLSRPSLPRACQACPELAEGRTYTL